MKNCPNIIEMINELEKLKIQDNYDDISKKRKV